jgi:hypothetical protein
MPCYWDGWLLMPWLGVVVVHTSMRRPIRLVDGKSPFLGRGKGDGWREWPCIVSLGLGGHHASGVVVVRTSRRCNGHLLDGESPLLGGRNDNQGGGSGHASCRGGVAIDAAVRRSSHRPKVDETSHPSRQWGMPLVGTGKGGQGAAAATRHVIGVGWPSALSHVWCM